jgi:hypothetical protein
VAFALVACGGSSAGSETTVEQVLAATDCSEPECVAVEEAERALGFAVLEPRVLPDGFRLVGRVLHTAEDGRVPPGAASSGPSGTGGQPRLVMTYRFQASVNVPAIVLTESRPAPPGSVVQLLPAHGGCGEVTAEDGRQTFYANGFASAEPGAVEGQLMVCPVEESPARDAHTVLVLMGEVLVEIRAFLESGVTKEEILDLAGSLAEAE